jgi:hypothetical protein
MRFKFDFGLNPRLFEARFWLLVVCILTNNQQQITHRQMAIPPIQAKEWASRPIDSLFATSIEDGASNLIGE